MPNQAKEHGPLEHEVNGRIFVLPQNVFPRFPLNVPYSGNVQMLSMIGALIQYAEGVGVETGGYMQSSAALNFRSQGEVCVFCAKPPIGVKKFYLFDLSNQLGCVLHPLTHLCMCVRWQATALVNKILLECKVLMDVRAEIRAHQVRTSLCVSLIILSDNVAQ
jgi:hypothetical protein